MIFNVNYNVNFSADELSNERTIRDEVDAEIQGK